MFSFIIPLKVALGTSKSSKMDLYQIKALKFNPTTYLNPVYIPNLDGVLFGHCQLLTIARNKVNTYHKSVNNMTNIENEAPANC